ncbi:MAG: ferredoxin--nitrite reductase [Campylobacterota bacterium]
MMVILEEAFEKRSAKVNKIEKIKVLKTPEEAYAQLETYARDGYDSIPAEDLSYFLKCFGVYDRPQTPKQFMIRVRIPGGQLTNEQAVVLGELARDYGQDYIDITTRMQIEFRYLNIEDIPTIFKRMADVGLSSYQTGVDNFRNILNDPLDADGMDVILPSQPLLEKLQEKFLYNYEWISVLPRKFNTSVTGALSNRSNAYGQDCCFVLAQKDGRYGYNLYLGGKVGQIAKSADIFLKDEDEVMQAYQALIELFRDYGYRDNRNKNRLYFLIQEVGMANLAAAIRERSGKDLDTAGTTMTQMDFADPDQGKIQLRNGSFAVHVVVPSGIFGGEDLINAAEASATYGDGRIRFDVEQSLYLMGVEETKLEGLFTHKLFEKYKSVNTPYFNHMIACAGTEHCPFGVIPNKPDAIDMANYLSEHVPLEDARIRMYWSACVKGCGIHGVADVGFEGCKAKVDGQSEYGVHILLGGKLTGEGEEGHAVLKTIPVRFAPQLVAPLMREYRRLKKAGESFEQFNDRVLNNYTMAAVGFMMRLKAYLDLNNIEIDFGFRADVPTGKFEQFEIFDFGRKLYYRLLEQEAYQAYDMFKPTLKSHLEEPVKTDSTIDQNLSDMIYKMIHPDEAKRAEVFTELNAFIAIY